MVQKDGSRMSKRIGSMSLKDIRDRGIEPMTLINYCARIGTSDAIEAFQSIDELVDDYSLTKISRSPARFSFDELMGLNKKIIQKNILNSMQNAYHYYSYPRSFFLHSHCLKNIYFS